MYVAPLGYKVLYKHSVLVAKGVHFMKLIIYTVAR